MVADSVRLPPFTTASPSDSPIADDAFPAVKKLKSLQVDAVEIIHDPFLTSSMGIFLSQFVTFDGGVQRETDVEPILHRAWSEENIFDRILVTEAFERTTEPAVKKKYDASLC